MQAKIMRYKVSHSYKKALFIKNGSINETYGLTIGKRLTKEDAQKLIKTLEG